MYKKMLNFSISNFSRLLLFLKQTPAMTVHNAKKLARLAPIPFFLCLIYQSNAVRLQLALNFILESNVRDNDSSIQFQVLAYGVNGWVGIGVNNRSGDMEGSDIFIGGYNTTLRTGYGADYHVLQGSKQPILDVAQNWILENAMENASLTHIYVRRPLVSPDKQHDLDILNWTMYLNWAYSENSDYVSSMHTERGSIRINFITETVGGNGTDGCPPTGVDIIPHPTLCSSYFICLNGDSFLQECADKLQFNPELKECDFPENVNCTELPKCSSDDISFHPYPGNCSLYILCVGGTSLIRQCAPGLCFDPDELQCRANATTYFDIPEPIQVEMDLDDFNEVKRRCEKETAEEFMLLPSFNSIDEFFVSQNGSYRVTLKCAIGQYFDFNAQICVV